VASACHEAVSQAAVAGASHEAVGQAAVAGAYREAVGQVAVASALPRGSQSGSGGRALASEAA
jgi:hypothetical protein